MKISLEYVAQVKEAAGFASESVTIPDGSTLKDLYKIIVKEKNSSFRTLVFDEKLEPVASILVIVNDEQIDDLTEYQLQNNDRVTILSPMSGG